MASCKKSSCSCNTSCGCIYNMKMKDIDGKDLCTDPFRCKCILIATISARCSMAEEFRCFNEMFLRNKEDLVVIMFPCDDNTCGPCGSVPNDTIKREACKAGASFELLQKGKVGDGCDMSVFLSKCFSCQVACGDKFLFDKNGRPCKHFDCKTDIKAIEDEIKRACCN